MSDLPVIDISPLMAEDGSELASLTRAIESACRDTGFMVIRGHGIPAPVVSRIRDAVMQFFSLPAEEKLSYSISRDNYRGYIPLEFFTPNRAGVSPDRYEGYKLHAETDPLEPICHNCALYGPNKWPGRPAGFRTAVMDYWQHCDRVAGVLLDALAHSLDVDHALFRQKFDQPLTNMTLLHYPPGTTGNDEFGIHPHKDTDALTILAPDPVGGLQIRPRGRQTWLWVEAPDDALIVNIGDLLETWSGGYFVSTPHRVINRSGRERYSFPYFAVPRFNVVVSPLRTLQPGFEYREIEVGAASREIWRSNWPDAAAIDARIDPATP